MRAICLVLFLVGCSPPAPPENPGGPPVCLGGPNEPAVEVTQRVAVTGRTVSSLRAAGDELFIVESGDNTISRFTPRDDEYTLWVDVGAERGPYDLFATDDQLWITNYVANTVTVADRATGAILAEIEHPSFDGPSGIAVLDGRAYVGNVQHTGENTFGPGSITVIDATDFTVFGARTTSHQNPQALDVVDGHVIVVMAGALGYDTAGGKFEVGTASAIEAWRPTEQPLQPEVEVAPLPLVTDRQVGALGRPALNGSTTFYLPSAVGPYLFKFDAATMTWLRGSHDPIRLYGTTRNALHHAAYAGDLVYVTAFNEDTLYLVDTTCDAVLDEVVLESTSALAGPHGVAPFGDDAYFALEFSMELGRATFDFQSP